MNLYRKPTSFVNNDVEQKCCNLTDYRCIGGALHPHSRTAQKSENHNRIQFVRNIPPLAYIPLVIVGAGVGEPSKIIVIFISPIPWKIFSKAI